MKRWLIPIALSLAFHIVLFCVPWKNRKTESTAVISVRLVRSSQVSSAKGGDTGKTEKSSFESSKSRPKAMEKKAEARHTQTEKKPEPKLKPIPKPKTKTKTEAKTANLKSQSSPQTDDGKGKAGELNSGNGPAESISGKATEGDGDKTGKNGILSEQDVTVVYREQPEYPLLSRKRKEEGIVTIVLSIEKGKVSLAHIEKGSGSPRLDKAALKALKKWRFSADLSAEVRIPVIFKLTK